ncbi:hypothetical protein B0H13DRAFT_2041621 [Mycena leptocephala]|nr:hypothetical protein B0H13DRAFT_2041621 [Mycena leptocephala]
MMTKLLHGDGMLAGQDTLLHLPTHTNSDVLVAIRKLAPHEGLSKHCVARHQFSSSKSSGYDTLSNGPQHFCQKRWGTTTGRRSPPQLGKSAWMERKSKLEGGGIIAVQPKYFNSGVQRVFSGRRKQENERIQLEADSTIGAGGYLGRRERVVVTSQAPVVFQIAGQFAPDLWGNQGMDTQLSNLSPARCRHVPQALSIVTATLPHFRMGRGISHTPTAAGLVSAKVERRAQGQSSQKCCQGRMGSSNRGTNKI